MKRILFVDDDAHVLESLRDALRPWRREWRPTFAAGGEAALEELASARFDVVVSDMRMPGMDGATLLGRVREEQPDAVRIILSGSTETDVLTRAGAVAHRFLAKPCDIDELARIVGRATVLGETTLASPLHHTASGATALPCAPALYGELVALLGRDSASMADVAHVVERDIAVTAKLLQLANSAFFGLPRAVTRVEEAVTYLGLGTIKAIVLAAESLAAFRPARVIPHFSVEELERHGAVTAGLARQMLPRGPVQDEACAAGMLHDIGWLVFAAQAPDHLAELVASAHREGRPVHELEHERGGTTHAEVGAHLLDLWGLPDTIVAAVAHHHVPPAPAGAGLDAVAAVYIAEALLDERTGNGGLDLDYVEALGVSDRLAGWRTLAAAM
jgi:HD-like signal output (HDOD) protein/ActR/RegA family two-component response regulator